MKRTLLRGRGLAETAEAVAACVGATRVAGAAVRFADVDADIADDADDPYVIDFGGKSTTEFSEAGRSLSFSYV